MANSVTCCEVILITLLSPVAYALRYGIDCGFIVNLVLYIVTFTLFGAIHMHIKLGLDCCTAILCSLLPPVAICFKNCNIF